MVSYLIFWTLWATVACILIFNSGLYPHTRWFKKMWVKIKYVLSGQRRTDRLIRKALEGWDFPEFEFQGIDLIPEGQITFSQPEPKLVVSLDEFTKFEFVFKGKRYSMSPEDLMFLMAPYLKLEEDKNERECNTDSKKSKGAWYSFCPLRGIVHRRLAV